MLTECRAGVAAPGAGPSSLGTGGTKSASVLWFSGEAENRFLCRFKRKITGMGIVNVSCRSSALEIPLKH